MPGEKPLLHILVIGFHHKKGCQVEFSYPELPQNAWKYLPTLFGREGSSWTALNMYLPTLAIPDGSHNFGKDTVYFNLPSLVTPTESIYGVSCYRQIPVEKLINKTSDVTRSTVQKSVTALLSVPIYGYVHVKLSLIADCFFNQGDFQITDILRNAYEQLNACLLDNHSQYERVPGLSPVESLEDLNLPCSGGNMFHIGLPLRDLMLRWRQKVLMLFKLLLLQRKVVCFGSPVRPMCDFILSIASLHPQLLERGFQQVACVRPTYTMLPTSDLSSPVEEPEEEEENDEKFEDEYDEKNQMSAINKTDAEEQSPEEDKSGDELQSQKDSDDGDSKSNRSDLRTLRGFSRETSVDALAATLTPLCSISPLEWGAPLTIFQGGCLCLPYLSLPYMDMLTDPAVIGYFIGTSNILFRQKRNLADILIDIETMQIDVIDPDLRRQIQLTTEDLRFFDYVMRHVQSPKENAEGSDRWVREQFQGYVLALLRTCAALPEGSKEVDNFNGFFVNQFKRTNCYVDWIESHRDLEQRLTHIPLGHPFAGTMSVQDVKLKFAHSIHSTEGGRKLNQAVNTTSKAVGGAITQAKGAFSNWWSAMTTVQPATDAVTMVAREGTQMSKVIEDDKDLESVANLPARDDGTKVQPTDNNAEEEGVDGRRSINVQEIGSEAEEFLESEVAEAKQATTHTAGEVFTV